VDWDTRTDLIESEAPSAHSPVGWDTRADLIMESEAPSAHSPINWDTRADLIEQETPSTRSPVNWDTRVDLDAVPAVRLETSPPYVVDELPDYYKIAGDRLLAGHDRYTDPFPGGDDE